MLRTPALVSQMILLASLLVGLPAPALSSPDFFDDSTLTGNIRSYFQSQDFERQADKSAYSLGGKLKLETGSLKGFKAGTAYYGATDFDINRDVSGKPNLFPSSIGTFGEAYLQYNNNATLIRIGRQLVDTPFMNPSDAHIAPVTFLAYSLVNNSLENFKFTAMHITEVKRRQNNGFENTGKFITDRLGLTPDDTDGATVLGVKWEKGNLKVQGWEYYYPDFYNLIYFQGDLKFAEVSGIKPFLSIQAGKQFDIEGSLVGSIDATAFGVKLGAEAGNANMTYAYNYLPENRGNFQNGGFVSPFSYATDALYTNSLDGGLTSKSSAFVGGAHKWMITYDFSETIWSKFSYTFFDLIKSAGGKDSKEINIDLMYKFQGIFKGLSLRNRLAIVVSDRQSENLIENRIQMQYVFGNLL